MHPGGEWLRRVPRNPFQAGCVYVLSHGSNPAPGSQVDEQQLIGRVRAGDPAAERQFFEAYADRIHRIVYRFVGDPEAAQDCVQETFIRAFDRLGTFRGESALGTWLYRLALNHCLDYVRSRQAKMNKLTDTLDAGVASFEPLARRDTPIARLDLERALERLPDGCREAFVLHDVEGFDHKEVGRVLGIAEGTSKSQVFKARARLRTLLRGR